MDDLDESLTTTLIGTSAYVPEEVFRDPKKRSVKQDVYACGILLYEVIVGTQPQPSDYEPIEDRFDGYAGIDKLIQSASAALRSNGLQQREPCEIGSLPSVQNDLGEAEPGFCRLTAAYAVEVDR